ncbi:hypothetical protein [Bacteroides bouchesdurhonensis]|uniref:hypothetical protein n=1 Tax=Bacteroides bouchesdurhonensis TaxID=1841855 RepID=UPI0011DDF144|nr:hypothetical protein [Bacteroides bouchesdurhonensis]
MEEENAESLGVRFCKYVFVSCWTENPEESIPLWKMYGGDFGGQKSQGFIITKIPKKNDSSFRESSSPKVIVGNIILTYKQYFLCKITIFVPTTICNLNAVTVKQSAH